MRKKLRVATKTGSIFNRFLILIVAVIILPMILVYSLVFSIFVENLHDSYNNSAELSSYMVSNATQTAMNNIIDISISMIGNERIQAYLACSQEDKDFLNLYYLARSDVKMHCQNSKYITNILIGAVDGKADLVTDGSNAYGFSEEERERMLNFDEPWFWVREKDGRIGICRLIRQLGSFKNIGFMKILIDEDILYSQLYLNNTEDLCQYALLDTQDDSVVIATEDEVYDLLENIYGNHQEDIRCRSRYVLWEDGHYLIFTRLGTKPVTLVTVAKDQTRYFNTMKYGIIFLLCLLFFIMSLIYAVMYRKSIAFPLRALCGSMKTLKRDSGAPQPVLIEAKGEIKDLVDSFNDMSVRLDYLYETNYKNELKLRDAKLLTLQSEMNPHFLYNVLDSVRWMIELGEKEAASVMVRELSEMYRLSLKLSDYSVVNLERELDHVKKYIAIEQYRFGDKIHFQMNIQDGLEKAQVVKFILQPLIENAVVHGILKSELGYGNVVLSVYQKRDELIYDIRDDGSGADSDRINEILNGKLVKEKSLEGFALENIQSRLQLRYGEGYGIMYRPRAEGGSIFCVSQPLVMTEEEEDAQIDDCG